MKKILNLIAIIIVLFVFLEINNKWLVTTNYVYESARVPSHFEGFRITQVSDLHDALFGKKQERLVQQVRQTKPDAIFITGDLIDSNRYHLEQSLAAVKELVKIAEVYYVIGNHEVATNEVSDIYDALKEYGVHILANNAMLLERQGQHLAIAGIEDPLMGVTTEEALHEALQPIPSEVMTVLLSHRPERFSVYVENPVDLVFTGHAHGGQIRLPFIGGLVAPGQGLLPQYTAGVYEEEGTKMVVSRGLGNSVIPYRVFNLPEIVTVELRTRK